MNLTEKDFEILKEYRKVNIKKVIQSIESAVYVLPANDVRLYPVMEIMKKHHAEIINYLKNEDKNVQQLTAITYIYPVKIDDDTGSICIAGITKDNSGILFLFKPINTNFEINVTFQNNDISVNFNDTLNKFSFTKKTRF